MHVHYAIPHAYAAYMAQKMLNDRGVNVPIITTLHGTDITLVGNLPFYKESVAFSINNSDIITTVSKSLKNDTLKLFDIKKFSNLFLKENTSFLFLDLNHFSKEIQTTT